VPNALPRFPASPVTRLGLAAAASILVVADLIVLVRLAALAPDQPSPASPTAVASVEPSVPASPPPSAAAPTTLAPTHAPAPAQRATPTTRPTQPPATRRTHSPFEQRCRDGEIPAWLCRDLPTDR
jgi:hypothetical protein